MPDINLKVIYCSEREPDREWDLASNTYEAVYLNERFYTVGDKFIHVNPDVFWALRHFKPEVVIGTGFNPTHLLAFLYTKLAGCAFIPMTDGTLESEQALTEKHRWIRNKIYRHSKAFIAASDGGFDLYNAYGVDSTHIFKSHLCTNNTAFQLSAKTTKKFDFIFSGRFGEFKNPFFALAVAKVVALKLQRKVSLAFLGAGPLEAQMRAAAEREAEWVDSHFLGFARQHELPYYYSLARIMLFPTLADVWGVVANEALAAGVPVIISSVAGCARELVRDGQNGFVLPLQLQLWCDAAICLLTDTELYKHMVQRGYEIVADYNYENAAIGIANAVRKAVGKPVIQNSNSDRALPKRQRVVIVQRRMMHYRIPLFEQMRKNLADQNVDLTVVQGDALPSELPGDKQVLLSWGVHIPCRYFLGGRLCWQNIAAYIKGADLVVVPQENKFLFNYLLIMRRSKLKIAYWGHGRNFQARVKDFLSEHLKRWLLHRADWWFAYTAGTARYLREEGFDRDKITTLNNTIDTRQFVEDYNAVGPAQIAEFLLKHDIPQGLVGLYCGALYKEKDIELLLICALKVRERINNFVLVIVGDGAERELVESYAAEHPWICFLGAVYRQDKAIAFKLANLILIPGVVGLVVVDSIMANRPLLTRDIPGHGPELDYLIDNCAGEVTDPQIDAYANRICDLLENPQQIDSLTKNCDRARSLFTIENMANEFTRGILKALNSAKD